MYKNTWNNYYSSICSISFYNEIGKKIGSGTGFKVSNYLVTNNHVFIAPGAVTVELRFVNSDGHSTQSLKTISYTN